MNLTKHNSPEEVEALKILTEGYLPQVEESDLKAYWLPRFMDRDDTTAINDWVRMIAKSVNQHVAVMSGGVRVNVVPPAVAPWPTEVPNNLRGTVSEIFAEAEAAARNIPLAGTTHIMRALDAQYRKISIHPALKAARDKHASEWEALAAHYGALTPKAAQTASVAVTKKEETSDGLFDDAELC